MNVADNPKETTARRVVTLLSLKREEERRETVTYVVRPGDTLESIAWLFFKNRQMKRQIMSANGLEHPSVVQGMTLRIPSVSQVPLPAAEGREQRRGQIHAVVETYVARGGESLEEIADLYYREASFARLVAEANGRPRHHVAAPGERLQVPFKVVEVRPGESIFSIAERETGLRNYFMKLMMINRTIRPLAGDRLRVPPARTA